MCVLILLTGLKISLKYRSFLKHFLPPPQIQTFSPLGFHGKYLLHSPGGVSVSTAAASVCSGLCRALCAHLSGRDADSSSWRRVCLLTPYTRPLRELLSAEQNHLALFPREVTSSDCLCRSTKAWPFAPSEESSEGALSPRAPWGWTELAFASAQCCFLVVTGEF